MPQCHQAPVSLHLLALLHVGFISRFHMVIGFSSRWKVPLTRLCLLLRGSRRSTRNCYDWVMCLPLTQWLWSREHSALISYKLPAYTGWEWREDYPKTKLKNCYHKRENQSWVLKHYMCSIPGLIQAQQYHQRSSPRGNRLITDTYVNCFQALCS